MEMYLGLGILAGIILIFVFAILRAKQRNKALEQSAGALGFSFDAEFLDEDDDALKSLGHLALFSGSRSQGAWNLMRRKDGDLSITILDHRYRSGSGSSPSKVSEQTVIVFQSSGLNLPRFTLRHDDLAHQLSTSLLGYQDIDFASHPAFSKRYHLNGIDDAAIRATFHEGVLSYFERHSDLAIDGSGGERTHVVHNRRGGPHRRGRL